MNAIQLLSAAYVLAVIFGTLGSVLMAISQERDASFTINGVPFYLFVVATAVCAVTTFMEST